MNPILIGVLICTAYGISLFGLIKLFGVKYTEITKSTSNLKRGIFLPVGIASIMLAILSYATGLLPSVFTPPQGSPSDSWMWVIPAALIIGSVVRFKDSRWHLFTPAGVFYLVVGALFVGFSEELLTRGLLVHFMSQAAMPQVVVMLGSSIIFGLLHGMNYFNGQDRKTTLSQMIVATIMGMSLYVSYTVSGSLWVPILLHALFDISLLTYGTQPDDQERSPSKIELAATLTFYTATFVVLINLLINWLLG